jgi:hypothetical protein
MNPPHTLLEKQLLTHMAAPDTLNPAILKAGQVPVEQDLLGQELEYLWDDALPGGHTYEVYLGLISRNPIVRSKISGKYFVFPWSLIMQTAAAHGIDV